MAKYQGSGKGPGNRNNGRGPYREDRRPGGYGAGRRAPGEDMPQGGAHRGRYGEGARPRPAVPAYPFKSAPPRPAPQPVQEPAPREEREDLIMGRNAVREALRAGRSLEKLWIQSPAEGPLRELYHLARDQKVVVQETDRRKLDELTGEGVHQGIVAQVSAKDYVPLPDILQRARDRGEQPFLVALDGITDPHNLGAIIRSAECAGAHGVIVTRRRSSGLTATVSKVSAGAVEYLPVARVANLPAALRDLKEQGLWVVGADMAGESCYACDLTGPTVLVIGGEGEGLSRLVQATCDRLVSIPIKGQIESLNASVATGVLLYEILRQRGLK